MKSLNTTLPVLGLAALLLSGCGGKKEHASSTDAQAGLPVLAVSLESLKTVERRALVEVVGTVRPAQRSVLSAKMTGAITELPIVLGQRVAKGELLARLSAGEIAARLQQAKSQLNQVSRDLGRERNLLAQGATTEESVKSLEDRTAMAQAAVKEAEVMMGYTELRAPYEGIITRRIANVGDLAAPGVPIVEMEGIVDFQVEAGVPDSLAAGLKIGAPVMVQVSGIEGSVRSTLVELSSAADALTRTVPAKFALAAGVKGLRSGQFVRLQLEGAWVRSLSVPEKALVRHGQMESVFVQAADGRAVLRIVRTGALRDGRREILAGLEDGDRVVVGVPAGLREGRKVEVAK